MDHSLISGIRILAFLVCQSRSKNVGLSHDIFAADWIPPSKRVLVSQLWEEFAEEVYPLDHIELSVRNRFILHRIGRFAKKYQDCIVVNFGSGLSSYPYLNQENPHFLEIDLPPLMTYKRDIAQRLAKAGVLPERKVTYLGWDLEAASSLGALQEHLYHSLRGRPSIFILEGLTYYLEKHELEKLVRIISGLQKTGDLMVFDFWHKCDESLPVFRDYLKFCSKHGAYKRKTFSFLKIPASLSILGKYQQVIRTDVVEQEARIFNTSMLSRASRMMPEHYVVLRKVEQG